MAHIFAEAQSMRQKSFALEFPSEYLCFYQVYLQDCVSYSEEFDQFLVKSTAKHISILDSIVSIDFK